MRALIEMADGTHIEGNLIRAELPDFQKFKSSLGLPYEKVIDRYTDDAGTFELILEDIYMLVGLRMLVSNDDEFLWRSAEKLLTDGD
jgi:hypothetical protein